MEQYSTRLRQLLQHFELNGEATSALRPHTSTGGVSVPPLSHSQEISSDWLTQALRCEDRSVGEVAGFVLEPFTETDFDTTFRLLLSYGGSSTDVKRGPTRLLCKMSKPLPAPRWGEFIEDVCHRETAAYRELKYHDVCRLPTLLFSATDKRRYTFLWEDHGACPVERQAADLNAQIDAVLRELALLHGCFARHSPVSAPMWLIRPRESAELIGYRYRNGVRCTLASDGGNLISAGHSQLIEQFAAQVVAWHRYEKHILTVTHGDVRSENMLYQGRGAACRATLVGWKLAGLRNPMFDVASFLSNSLSIAERRAREMDWLERYRRQFEHSGTHYSRVEARQDYRFHLFAPLIFNVCAAGFLGEPVSGNRALMENIGRNCQAILDWDAWNSLRL